MSETIRVRTLDVAGEREIRELSDVLIDCVEGGASVSFMLPIARTTADAFWRGVAAAVERGERILLVAENAANEIIGRSLLVLDTASGDGERLYAKLGWQRCGVIPGYALLPGGGRCDTTFFYRTL